MRYLLSGTRNSLVERLHAFHYTLQGARERPFLPLGELVIIRRGEELSKNSTYLFKTQPLDGQSWYPVLRGGSAVRPYMPPSGDSWIAREHIVKSMERYLAPKLLVVKSTSRLQATLDLRSHIVLQTLYLLYLRSNITDSSQISQSDELYFLLALLNSRLLQEYVYVLYTAYKWVQPQIEQHVLAHLPVPTIGAAEKARIGVYAKALMHACSERMPVVELSKGYKQMYEELERAVCALYEQMLKSC